MILNLHNALQILLFDLELKQILDGNQILNNSDIYKLKISKRAIDDVNHLIINKMKTNTNKIDYFNPAWEIFHICTL